MLLRGVVANHDHRALRVRRHRQGGGAQDRRRDGPTAASTDHQQLGAGGLLDQDSARVAREVLCNRVDAGRAALRA
jgi:hypothetical protein